MRHPLLLLALATTLACGSEGSRRDSSAASAVFGGGDASYDDPAKQAMILALWVGWQAEHCP